jgi:dTDP-4-amino-4,6-dideoxygalactose transaminase
MTMTGIIHQRERERELFFDEDENEEDDVDEDEDNKARIKRQIIMEERKTIYLCLAHMSEEGVERKYVQEAFDTNWVVPMGPNVDAFEKDLEAFVNGLESGPHSSLDTSHASLDRRVVCLSAGTAAVHLALIACGVQAGDEVCVQSFTFCASSHPITYLGATPVFIGSEKETWNMDPALLEKAILDRKEKTGKYPKAIIPVALYGMPYQIDKIMTIADTYGIPVIEDAAEGMGSRFNGQVLGTFGKFGVLSFNGNKMITTSGGGALICRNDEDANRIMWYATQARDAYPYYHHTAIGYNYRMSNICAGIGRGQMTVLNDHIAHHKHVQAMYEELLHDVPGIHLLKAPRHENDNENFRVYDANYWLCAATIDPDIYVKGQENAYKEVIKSAVGGAAGVIHAVDSPTTDCQPNDNVEAMRVFMLNKKVECRPVWKPMHKQPVYADAPVYTNGVEEEIFKVGMCLPAGPYVSDEDVHYIVDCIKEAIGG